MDKKRKTDVTPADVTKFGKIGGYVAAVLLLLSLMFPSFGEMVSSIAGGVITIITAVEKARHGVEIPRVGSPVP